MTLGTTRLGSTGMEVSRIGLGTWVQGGGGWAFGWGPQDDGDSIATIHRALQVGINWIDTAPAYGNGHAEEVIGKALGSVPEADRPYVFTKAGRLWDEIDPFGPLRIDLTPASVRTEVDSSLRRLQTERIDLLQVHWPPVDGTSVESYWSTFVELRKEGKVRAIGLCNHSVEAIAEAEVVGHVDTLQIPFSLIRREAASGEIPWGAEHETGVIVYAPLQAGLLTGTMTAPRVAALPDDDWRKRNPEFMGEKFARNLSFAEELDPVARRHGTTRAAVAVAWVLTWAGVTGAIVGARRPDQVNDWATATDLSLTDVDLDEIAIAVERSGAGAGPTRPPAPANSTTQIGDDL
jgi:aryl-alcohol dehydrogenase-like predicted oxidoreductase